MSGLITSVLPDTEASVPAASFRLRRLRAGIGRRPLRQQRLVRDHGQPAAPQPVPGLPQRDRDDPGPDLGRPTERPGPLPHGQHGVLEDLLAQAGLADDEADLGQHGARVPLVQRAERIPVTVRDLVEQHRVIGPGMPGIHRLPPGHQHVPHAL
jgi:hypothetical protein